MVMTQGAKTLKLIKDTYPEVFEFDLFCHGRGLAEQLVLTENDVSCNIVFNLALVLDALQGDAGAKVPLRFSLLHAWLCPLLLGKNRSVLILIRTMFCLWPSVPKRIMMFVIVCCYDSSPRSIYSRA